ncbi:MAG: AMP-binding protein [SAR202 cluster bacterium]|jgi:cyclohexanecarboxylate-CoA ligase|nr:AMP-binding protein [SAR202 cluster bacterium]MDP6514818.1 AMP-binding protein [SAR202 cluster bacterium]
MRLSETEAMLCLQSLTVIEGDKMLQTPSELVERYQREEWWGDMVVTDYLDRWADEKPDQVALVSHFYATDHTETLSYRQLHRLVERAAWALLDLGVEPGDAVAVQLPNWWHFTLLYLACVRIGAAIVPITPIMRHRQIRLMLGRTEARVMAIPPKFRNFDYGAMMEELSEDLPSLRAVIVIGEPVPEGMLSFERDVLLQRREVGRSREELQRLRPDPVHAVSAICFTSGTTGEPKGVMHNQATIMYHSRSAGESALGLTQDDRILMGSPLGHYTGFAYGINMPLALGSKAVLMDMWEPNTAVRLIDEEEVSWTMGATPFLMDLARSNTLEQHDVSSLRYFVCAGATIPSALVEEAHHRLPCRVISVWGMTEDGAVTFISPDDPPSRAAESDGGPVPGMEVRIVDPVSRKPLPSGTEGLLVARGPGQFVGYYKRPDLWEEAHDGQWFNTGDLARMDEQGYIRISGRTKDIVIRGGENVPVVEVEEILFRHPKVREVAVVATPDPRMGERACACVALSEGEQFTFEELQAWFDQNQTAKQYWPERLEVFDELPKTPSGKIQKFLLRDLVADRQI